MPPRKAPPLPSIAGTDWLDWPETKTIFAVLSQDGHATRAVGGAVRNTLLGEPVDEVDFATTARPQEVASSAGRAGLKVIPTSLDHGTVTVVAGERPFEVTTLRRDVETYGRRAKVVFTTDWEVDASRRDFTMNALYASSRGDVFDPIGGFADLTARKVRFIGDAQARICEDYLRILRFFRINALFATPPYSRDGLRACVLERGGLAGLSAERVWAELLGILAAPGATDAAKAMNDYGLLTLVLGGVASLESLAKIAGVEARLGKASDAVRRLASIGLLVDEDVDRLTQRLRLSKAETKRLGELLLARKFSSGIDEFVARELLYRMGPNVYGDAVMLAWSKSAHGFDDKYWRHLHALPERWCPPSFPLTGADLAALGVAEGPLVGELLDELELGWIASDFQGDRFTLTQAARALIATAKDAMGGKTT